MELTGREGRIARVTGRPDPNYAVEEGWLSDLSRFAYAGNHAASRLRTPIIRDGERARDATFEDAVDAAALVLRHSGRVGILVGPTATVEEGFCPGARRGRLPGAIVQRLGMPGDGLEAIRSQPAAQLGDIDAAGLVVIVGGDPANQQAIVELRVRKARRLGAEWSRSGPGPMRSSPWTPPSVGARRPGDRHPGPGAAGGARGHRALGRGRPRRRARRRRGAGGRVAALGARQIELGADVNGAGLRALGLPAPALLEAAQAGEIDMLLTVKADPLDAPAPPTGAGRSGACARASPSRATPPR